MMKLKYTNKSVWMFMAIMPMYPVFLNYIIFGNQLFSSFVLFAVTYLTTFLVFGGLWQVHDRVAMILQERIPNEKDYLKQFFFKICFFILIKSLTLHFLFFSYEYFYDKHFDTSRYVVLLVVANIINVLVSIMHESALGLERWKAAIVETERLKNTYMESRLWSLKSQMNPHFLFNNLNTLSSLIEEDEEAAEKYLDEISKVYRYLLKNNEEPLVPLQDEIKFIRSYYHILQARHGAAIQLHLCFDKPLDDCLIPPLSLQAILETTLNEYELNKKHPLQLAISLTEDDKLRFENSVPPKSLTSHEQDALKLQNLVKKFEMVTRKPVKVFEEGEKRTLLLPLVKKKQEVRA